MKRKGPVHSGWDSPARVQERGSYKTSLVLRRIEPKLRQNQQ